MQLALLQHKLQQLFGQIRGVVAKNTKKKKKLVFELKRINDHRLWVEEFIVYCLATG